MRPKDWTRIKSAFWKAVDGDPPASGSVADSDALDPAAQLELDRLLDEHRRLELESVAEAVPASITDLPDRFSLLRRLGSGTFGDVYHVFDRTSGTALALKILRDSQSAALYYFKREFRELADVRHPNIVTLYELLVEQGQWMFTMEFVDGKPLLQFIESGPASERETRLRMSFHQLATGLHALHERELLHRDLKPSNVLVTSAGRVVILDFGLVRSVEQDERQSVSIVGTPGYMSPEQAAGLPLTEGTDWYAFGAMLYEALTGTLPFTGGLLTVLLQKQWDRPTAPEERTTVPPDLNELCLGLLAIDPSARLAFEDVQRLLKQAPRQLPPDIRLRQLIGRDRQLQQLWAAHATVKDTRRPVVVHVTGASGIGKTSLIREFANQLTTQDAAALILGGRCFQSESVPYQGLDDLVDHLSHYLRHLDPDALDGVLPRNFDVLVRMFPVLGLVRAAVPSERLPLDSHELRLIAFSALAEMLGRLADRVRLIVTIDDLQWADMDGCAFFKDLLTGPGAPPILLLLAYRTEAIESSPWLVSMREGTIDPTHGHSVHVTVDRLESDEAAQLAQRLARADAPLNETVLDRIERQSGGEPFLVHEIMRWVNAHGVNHALAEQFSLANVVRARTLELSGNAQLLLELIAVAGQPTSLSVIEAAYRSNDLVDQRDRLVQERFIRSHSAHGQELLEPFHDRIRSVLIEQLPSQVLAERHLQLAEGLERLGTDDVEGIATHFAAAHDANRTTVYALKAAKRAMNAFAFNKAAHFYRVALSSGALDKAARPQVYRDLGDAYANGGRGFDAATAYLAAAESSDSRELVPLRAAAASQLLRCGHIRSGVDMLEALVRETGLVVWRNRLLRICHVLWLRAQIRLRGLAERDAKPSNAADARMDVCWTGAVGTSMIEPLRSAEFSARYVLLALKSGDPRRIALALAGESTQVCHTPSGGSPRQAQELLARAAALADRIGDPYVTAFVTLMKGVVTFLQGEWNRGAMLCDEASNALRSDCVNFAWEQSTAYIIAFNARSVRGDWRVNRERLPALIRDAERRGDLLGSVSLRIIGCSYLIDLARDDPDRAMRQLDADMRAWPHDEYDLQKACALLGAIDIDLYRERPLDAWKRVTEEWPQLRRSQLLRVPTMFAFMRFGRARAALAAAASPDVDAGSRAELLAAATEEVRLISRDGATWSRGLAKLAQSGLATFESDEQAVCDLLREAEGSLLGADLTGYAIAAAWRRCAYEGKENAENVLRKFREWSMLQELSRPERFANTLAPGLFRSA